MDYAGIHKGFDMGLKSCMLCWKLLARNRKSSICSGGEYIGPQDYIAWLVLKNAAQ